SSFEGVFFLFPLPVNTPASLRGNEGLSSDGLSAKCMCPLGCEGKAEETVCGSDGEDYRNECELHQHACKNQKNIRVQYQGHCGEIPLSLLHVLVFYH
uniref:Kazal-like domain-containing protein n=1 Tax=Seriola dumerili TaxID=41447 RepID=A0A3B4T965_SERDU